MVIAVQTGPYAEERMMRKISMAAAISFTHLILKVMNHGNTVTSFQLYT